MRSTRALGGFWALAAVLAGCAPAPEPPAPAPPAPVVTRYEPPPREEPKPRRELCSALAALLAAEPDGFAKVRGAPVDDESWVAALTLPGTQRCLVEGEAWPHARLSCAGPPIARDRSETAQAAFDALAREIDRCLDKPIWFPRDWEKGQAFEFALGERMLTWTDQTTSPPSAVVLKVQQDIASRDYRVKLNLEAVR